MFGEELSESPRRPSPWRAVSLSSSKSPSPLYLPTPTSTPSTPKDRPITPLRSETSLETLLSSGLDELDSFETLAMDDVVDDDKELTGPSMHAVWADTGLPAEVDHCGHIEYKLKLLSPSPLRMAKLVTQLKWRLVEGGGMALYELGILDNGTLVGLPQSEMADSLQTLGAMLGALGGGEIRIGRVIQVSGRTSDASSLDLDLATGPDEDEKDERDGPPLFASFSVGATTETENVKLFDAKSARTASTVEPIAIRRAPHPARTPEERALLKRSKRDERRVRRESDGEWVPHTPRPWTEKTKGGTGGSADNESPRPPRAPRPAKVKLSQSAPAKALPKPICPLKPAVAKDGEVRYVVEAVVLKRGGLQRRGGSDEEPDSPSPRGTAVDAEDDLEEGWRYLEFDFMEAARRKAGGASV